MSDWHIDQQVEYQVFCGGDFRGRFDTEAEAKAFIEGFKAGLDHGRAEAFLAASNSSESANGTTHPEQQD